MPSSKFRNRSSRCSWVCCHPLSNEQPCVSLFRVPLYLACTRTPLPVSSSPQPDSVTKARFKSPMQDFAMREFSFFVSVLYSLIHHFLEPQIPKLIKCLHHVVGTPSATLNQASEMGPLFMRYVIPGCPHPTSDSSWRLWPCTQMGCSSWRFFEGSRWCTWMYSLPRWAVGASDDAPHYPYKYLPSICLSPLPSSSRNPSIILQLSLVSLLSESLQ